MSTTQPGSTRYLDNTGRADVLSGGVRLIPIDTPKGTFRVWTKRVGNSPTMKVLLLHGGPGATHEYFEAFDSYFPGRGDRVLLLRPARLLLQRPAGRTRRCGNCRASSTRSSRSGRRSGWTATTSFCSGTRGAASSRSSTRCKYQQHLKGLVISNMMASVPGLQRLRRGGADAGDGPGGAGRDQGLEAAGDYENPRYMELLIEHHYVHHVLRMPRGGMAGPGQPRVRAHQPGDLRPDAGTERAGAERQAA